MRGYLSIGPPVSATSISEITLRFSRYVILSSYLRPGDGQDLRDTRIAACILNVMLASSGNCSLVNEGREPHASTVRTLMLHSLFYYSLMWYTARILEGQGEQLSWSPLRWQYFRLPKFQIIILTFRSSDKGVRKFEFGRTYGRKAKICSARELVSD
jgi:hypothetical protein